MHLYLVLAALILSLPLSPAAAQPNPITSGWGANGLHPVGSQAFVNSSSILVKDELWPTPSDATVVEPSGQTVTMESQVVVAGRRLEIDQDVVKTAGILPNQNLAWVTDEVTAPGVTFRTFDCKSLPLTVSYHVFTPALYDKSDLPYPVLYWLHGTGGGIDGIRPLAQYFRAAMQAGTVPPMIIVFANGLPASLWANSKNGSAPVETVFISELIAEVDRVFRTIPKREGRILEGFSMGGYGAARLGFGYPDLFAGISILAGGPLDLELDGPKVDANPKVREKILRDVCGNDLEYFKSLSPLTLAPMASEALRNRKTVIRQAVGDRDVTFELNRQFHVLMTDVKIPHEYYELPGIGHDTMAVLSSLDQVSHDFYRRALGSVADLPNPITTGWGVDGPHPVTSQTLTNPHPEATNPITVFLPTDITAPMPTVFFCHGYGSQSTLIYLGLLRFLAGHGVAVVHVAYPATGVTNHQRYEILWEGFRTAVASLPNRLDPSRLGVVGHSFGGGATAWVAWRASVGEGWGRNGVMLAALAPYYSFLMPTDHWSQLPATMKSLVQVYADDETNDERIAIEMFHSLPGSDMYQWVPSDAHNAEAHIADHAVPSGGGGYKVVDRLDHYAVRRQLHLLTAATLFHDAAAQALLDRRNDPDLINLGQWNDGTVVQPLQILNEPTTSRPTESFKNPLADRQLVQARPTVDFTGPLTTVRGQTVTFTATASDSDGNVDNVALLVNGQVMDVRTAPPWNLVWTAVTDGSVAIGVRAEDDDGMMATSVEKNLDVTAPPLPPSGTSGESADGGSGGGCGSGGLALVMAAGFAFNLVRRRSQYQFK